MKTEYKTELGKSYMILECEEKEDFFAVQMLEENHIRSLLPFERRCFNGKLQFFYEVTGMTALADRIEKMPLGEKDMRRLLQGLYCVFEEMHSFFLEPEGLLLQAEYIFETQDKVFFCYCPFHETDGLCVTEIFAEKLLDQIDTEEEAALELAYQFYALVKDARKGILYILEEVLAEGNPDSKSEEELLPVFEYAALEENKEPETKKHDVYTMVCFLFSFLAGAFCFFQTVISFMQPIGMCIMSGVLMAFSVAGMIADLTDIDIVRKK